ncbi:MAG: helix-turn-helix domain-containing protein [Pseudonocardiaceae bacterium]
MTSASNTASASTSNTDLLTVKEVCAKLRISAWTFYQLVQKREIKTITIGRRRLMTRAALEEFMQQRSEEAA